jgi:site-specific recombinase XerD
LPVVGKRGDLTKRRQETVSNSEALPVRSGKGRKDRVVPVVRRAADALDFYLRVAREAGSRKTRRSVPSS